MKPLLQLQSVSKRFGSTPVLRNISFAVNPGAHRALLGPSGGGKSTVLRLVAGLETPSEGHVLLNGRVVSAPGKIVVPPCQRQVAMVFQDLALWPDLTVRENVQLGLAGSNLSRQVCRERASATLALCNIERLAEAKPGRLSGGEQQRVALARALAVRPRLLLLDEPFSGLDIALKDQLFEEIQRLIAQFSITLLLVSHDPWEITRLCGAAAVLEQGQLVEEGSLAGLLQHPRTCTSRALARVRS